jgi:SnoaL-like protein
VPDPFDRYVAAWNEGDLERWLGVHHDDVEYVSLAGSDARVYRGHEGLREAWAESRANWHRFVFSILDDDGSPIEVQFSGMELHQGTELSGVLWFRVEHDGERIQRIWSALDAALIP